MGAEMYISCQQKRRKYVDHVLADQCHVTDIGVLYLIFV